MNKFLYLLSTLLIPIGVGVIGHFDNTQEFSYPFIIGFLIALFFYFPKFTEAEDSNNSKF